MPDQIAVQPLQQFDLGKGLSNISSLVGIKQQQQDLQTGAAQQQSAEANASQDAQKNTELKAAQTAIYAGTQAGRYTKQDGSFDSAKASNDLLAVAPTYGGAAASGLLSNANEMVRNKQEVQKLTDTQRGSIGTTLQSLAADPQVSNSKVIDAVGQLREQNPDPGFGRLLDSTLAHLPPNSQPADLQKMLSTMAGSMTQTSPVTAGTVDSGSSIMTGTFRNATGAFQPASEIAKATPQGVTVGPSGEVVRVAAGGAGLPTLGSTAANLNTQQQTTYASQAKGVSDRVEQAKVAANNTVGAQDALTRAKTLLESPESPLTGTNFESFKSLKNTMSSLGIDTEGANDMNTLSKNLARYEAARATQAGLGGTDAARELAHAGSPNTSLDNKALLGVVRQSLASEQALSSYAKVQSKTTDPQALVKNEADFRNIPNLIQAHEYGMMKNQKEADAFLEKHGLSKAQMAKSRAAIKEFDSR